MAYSALSAGLLHSLDVHWLAHSFIHYEFVHSSENKEHLSCARRRARFWRQGGAEFTSVEKGQSPITAVSSCRLM